MVEIVLTAHPTQVNRRTLQYKHTKIAHLLQQHDRKDLTQVHMLAKLMPCELAGSSCCLVPLFSQLRRYTLLSHCNSSFRHIFTVAARCSHCRCTVVQHSFLNPR